MKFEDVRLDMWLKYENRYWYVTYLDDELCALTRYGCKGYNNIDLNKHDFETTVVENVKPPVYHNGDVLIYIGEALTFKDKLATIISNTNPYKISPYRIRIQDDTFWVSAFDLQPIEY